MYIKNKMSPEEYKELASLMRSLMIKWKSKDGKRIIKEISMPDMIDILSNNSTAIYENAIRIYWEQIKEKEDKDINQQIYLAIRNNLKAATELYGCGGFTQDELQWIINNYIKNVPVIYIKED